MNKKDEWKVEKDKALKYLSDPKNAKKIGDAVVKAMSFLQSLGKSIEEKYGRKR